MIAYLCDGRSYGLPGAEVERITTHAAHVFLVGGRAYKMKRAVRYSFLDFTTLDRRRRALEAELALNRRTAPMLYRRLVPVTRADGDRLALAGPGKPVEWLLEMARFDQEAPARSRRRARPAHAGDRGRPRTGDRGVPRAGGRAHRMRRLRRHARGDRGQRRGFRGAARGDLRGRAKHPADPPLPRRAGKAAGPARAAPARRPGAPLPRRSASGQHRPARGPAGAVRLPGIR